MLRLALPTLPCSALLEQMIGKNICWECFTSESAFQTHFSRRPPLRFEPPFEVLDANLVLNLWVSDEY